MEDPLPSREVPNPSGVSQTKSSWLSSWFSWCPTSQELLRIAEERILKHIKTPYRGRFVSIGNSKRIWTAVFNDGRCSTKQVPLVMVHGFGGGIGLWALNLDSLAKNKQLYAFDLLGFGRSSREPFSTEADKAEDEFVESIELWRKEVGLEKFVLLGHSLGGFLASSYALKHPEHVQHLILADPWGFPEKPSDAELTAHIPTWVKAIAAVLSPFNPLAAVRGFGPLGPYLVEKFRPDLNRKFSSLFDDDTVSNYIYHCNAQDPSGETAFKDMMIPYGWAKYPMLPRIGEMDPRIPITMIYGSRSWMDREMGYKVKNIRRNSFVGIEVVMSAGHHVYADKPENFNNIVNKIMEDLDEKKVCLIEDVIEEECDFEIIEK